MNSPLIVVADADAIVGQASPSDNLHNRAVRTAQRLAELNAQIVYPVTAIVEATTHIQRVLGSTVTAYGTAINFIDPNINIVEVNQQTIRHALDYFSPITSKKNTLYDCIVAAVAREYDADAIFSFDKFYKKKGFKLASEL